MADITQAIHFLNSTVVSFNASLGFNSNPSTLSVTLAEDPDINPPEEFGDTNPASNSSQYAVGGTRWADGNPGTYVEFEAPAPAASPNDQFKFAGFVTDWRRKNDVGGNLVTVNISDPRILFSGIPIITDIDSSGASWPEGRNIVDVLGYWGNIVNAGWTRKGMPWLGVYNILNNPDTIYNIYDQDIRFLVNGWSDPAIGLYSWFDFVDDNYRLPIQNTTLDQFFNKVASDHNIDYYAKATRQGTDPILVTLYPVPRSNVDDLDNTLLHSIISSWADVANNGEASRLKSVDYGRELRTDPSHVMLWGDNKKSFSINNQTDHKILPIYDRFTDGAYSDRIIIDLSNIEDVSGLPTINVERMNLTGYGTSSSPYIKSRTSVNMEAYSANVNILRAALHSKDSWATAVWYAFKDMTAGDFDVLGTNDYDSIFSPLGGSGGSTGGGSAVSTPEKLGILKPPFDRSQGAVGFNAFSSAGNTPTSYTEAKKEAVYRVTKKAAEEYYGRTYITPLPSSSMIDTLINAGLGGTETGNSYVSKDKRFLVEYEVVSEGWPVSSPNSVPLSSWFPYEMTVKTDSDEFQTQDGLVKGIVRFNQTKIKQEYPQADFVNMPTDRFLKAGGDQGADKYLYTSAASFNQYQFDPRFVIIKVNDHIDLGFDVIRGITLVTDTNGNVISHATTSEAARPPKDKDMSGGTQEFISQLYYGFTIVTKLTNAGGDPVHVIDTATVKKIDAEHYYNLLYHSSISYKEKLGFAEMRFLGYNNNGSVLADSINTATPLKWNFIRYGPFEGGPLYTDTGAGYSVLTKNEVDNSLNPWNYGGVSLMNAAGQVQADNMQSASTTLAYANAAVEGFPEMALGQDVGGITRLSNVSLSYSTTGVTTQYRFKTFFGPVGVNKKAEIDKIYRITTDRSSGEDKISVEAIRREMIKAAKQNQTGVTLNGLRGGGGGSGAGTGSANTIKGTRPSTAGSQGSSVDILSDDEMNQALLGLDWEDSYYSKVDEIYTPYRTGRDNKDERVPDIEGVGE